MSSKPKTLLILAAGMGRRYGGLKQLDPMGPSGETVLDYSVYDALRAGFGKVVFIIRRDFESSFRKAVGSRFEDRIDVDYAFQQVDSLPSGFEVPDAREKPWGTGHAVLAAAGCVDGPMVVINADDFYGRDAYRQVYAFLEGDESGNESGTVDHYAMVGFRLANTLSDHGTVARGICEADASDYLVSVEEITNISRDGEEGRACYPRAGGGACSLTGEEIASMNMWGFTPMIFESLERLFTDFLRRDGAAEGGEFYIPSAVDQLIREERADVKILKTDSRWFGVTYKEDKPQVVRSIRDLVASGQYPEDLWSGAENEPMSSEESRLLS